MVSSSVTACAALRESVSRRRRTVPRRIESSTWPDHQFRAQFLRATVAEVDYFGIVVTGIDMHQRKRQRGLAVRPEAERLQREVQHDDRILAARKQQRGPAALGDEFAQDMNRLGFEPVEVVHPGRRAGERSVQCGIERAAHVHVLRWFVPQAVACGTVSSFRLIRQAAPATTGIVEMCSPHSFVSRDSHHQRPARLSSPGRIARVHGSQPMLG